MSLVCHRLFHAGYQIQSKNACLLIDPILFNHFSVNLESYPPVIYDYEKLKSIKIDALFISHIHDDHLSLNSLNQLNREIPIYLYSPTHSRLFELIKSLGFLSVHALEVFSTYTIKDLSIQVWPALDNEVDCVLSFHSGETHILNVVDSWLPLGILPQLQKIKWNLVLWPFQYMRELEVLSPDRFTANISSVLEEHLEQISRLAKQVLVMSSCQFRMIDDSWLNHQYFSISYQSFQQQLNAKYKELRVIQLLPGQGLKFDSSLNCQEVSPLNYVSSIDLSQSNDYHLVTPFTAPRLSHLSSNLGQLKIEAYDFLLAFTKYSLVNLLASIAAEPDKLFSWADFKWRLIIYDHRGYPEVFHFIRQNNYFKLVSTPFEVVDWETEIAATRFYQALTQGFPLTSLYMQIARNPLSVRAENYLQETCQLLEDPLIQILYTYQPLRYFDHQYVQIRLGHDHSNCLDPIFLIK